MQANVFTDKALGRYAGQFVWLSIDGENSRNAAFLARYKVEGYPSFYIIDPAKEKVALRWLGGATVPQLTKLFADGRRSVRGNDKGVDALLARADKLYGEGKNAEAATAYREALKAAPGGWSRFGRTTESLLFALQGSGQTEPCATVAIDSYSRVRDEASAANVVAVGLDCALQLPKDDTMRAERVKRLELASREVLANRKVVVAADDRSGVYQILIAARADVQDWPGEKQLTEEWAAFLEKEAEGAKSAEARAVYDSHRLTAYLALKQPERAIPMLERSQRELPGDYNPPARLAVALNAMKKYDEALVASDRALALAYGPRKLGIYRTRADILQGKGDAAGARKALEDAIALAESLPAAQRSDRAIASLKKQLEMMAMRGTTAQ